ncbi:histidine phosphatase family protein [Anaerobacillus alkaliphilus]|uniref:Histidine phosphatase family protein n=1 Tax=Anaerobacillus alkaliphilus TaxID=1548597 RepID=A0A4Q0W1X1_9BACI|nr:histidine phosphatase family protein [Anaerobacillus alkaliphilus]RXJ04551.1 histidine phosphatase family protein [Anaerobacillus alkaliphilus]
MQILLIRHGESEADLLNVHEGSADFPLTEEGIVQAKKMAARVKGEFPPQFIWASTFKRASKTAAILAEEIGCPIEYVAELREHENGDLAGKPLEEIPYPWGLLPHEKFGGYGESAMEFRARGEQIFSVIKEASKNYERIAIVSHGGMISRIIESFLELPFVHNVFFKTGDTGIHLLEYTDKSRLVVFSNSTTHLEYSY